MFGFDMNKSIQELEDAEWHGSSSDSNLAARCTSLWHTPLNDFTVADLRLMIGQLIGLKFLVPIAVDCLLGNPYVEGDLYPGDLLACVLNVDPAWWTTCEPWLLEQFKGIISAVEEDMRTFTVLIERFRSQHGGSSTV